MSNLSSSSGDMDADSTLSKSGRNNYDGPTPRAGTTAFFPGAHNPHFTHSSFNDVGRDQYITHTYNTSPFNKLNPVERGGYYVSRCMAGTREKIFEEINHWLENDNVDNILWLVGNPGAGKSAIASSLEAKCIEDRRPHSSFFFKRGDVNLGNPVAVWRTVAHDLTRDSKFASNLQHVLEQYTIDPGRAEIALHFRFLIKVPMIESYGNSPSHTIPIIIIDALDECDSHGSQEMQRRAFVESLVRWQDLPKKFKLVVTSRDEHFIPQEFRSVSKSILLPTGDNVNSDSDVNRDMHLFFKKRFAEKLSHLPKWPGDDVLKKLTTQAAGLFIWAEMVVKFVAAGLPEKRLASVLEGGMGAGNEVAKLYDAIIESSFPETEADLRDVFHPIVSAIVLAKVPLRVSDVADIISQPESAVRSVVSRLSSVISTGTDHCLRVGHLSFTEFLCDTRSTVQERKWFIMDRNREGHALAKECFRLMKRLEFNICGLQSSYPLNVKNLSRPIEEHIPPALFYSCRFWVAHLLDATTNGDGRIPENSAKEAEEFLYERALFWLEVMSLKKELTAANVALLTLSSHIREDLAMFCQDISRFIVNFYDLISERTPHIYISALPFSPKESLFANHYRPRFPRTLAVISGGDQKWLSMKNIFRGHTSCVRSVAFSPNGKWIASGAADKTIYIWDAENGDVAAGPLEGHTDSVLSVAFSPDSQWVASGSCDNTVCIWDIRTAQIIAGPFKDHTDSVFCVVFSPDGQHIASGSADKTVRIWDIRNSHVIGHSFKGHTNWVFSVAFSPNGKRVASGSADNTIRIWDSEAGRAIVKPFKGHTDSVHSVAFSAGGNRIASGSADKSIRVWDAQTGNALVNPFEGHTDWVNSIAFSPDDRWIVSGSDDNVIYVWNSRTGKLISGPFDGHANSVESVAFSPDSKSIASGSGDNTIRIWDVGTPQTTNVQIIRPHAPDIALGSCNASNMTVRFRDVKASRNEDPVGSITDAVVLVDSQRDASGSRVTLRMWDIKTNEIMGSPFADAVGVVEVYKDIDGWITCSDLAGYDPTDRNPVFWIPKTCREAVCGIETLAVFNRHATRLDLSRLEHGETWIRCYDPHVIGQPRPSLSTNDIPSQSVQHPADNPTPPCLPVPKESISSESANSLTPPGVAPPGHPMSATDHHNSVKQTGDSPRSSPLSDQSVSSYTRPFQQIALILIPLTIIYYFYTISK